MTALDKFMFALEPHLRPETATERLKMRYAYAAGHMDGLGVGLDHMNATLLRVVPKKEPEADYHVFKVSCPSCQGFGFQEHGGRCMRCSTSGQIEVKRNVERKES